MANVVVTGFGPFGVYKINPSWEVAKELKNLEWEANGINLTVEPMSVIYKEVEEKVPNLWQKHKPQLMVHLGVSSQADDLTLELSARKDGYKKSDINGQLPTSPQQDSVAACFTTCFNAEKVAKQFNGSDHNGITCSVSCDAGNYLCEYIYFNSLKIYNGRTIFIHIPETGRYENYTVKTMASAIREIILLLLDEVQDNCPASPDN